LRSARSCSSSAWCTGPPNSLSLWSGSRWCSIGSIGLLYWLIRHQAATSVASLFYLVPAVTALMAFVLFDERLDAVAIAGMIACAAAVLLVNRAPAKS
jgi:drug/metabolite transporter (DMT)-like permease